jgi:hypothetical protein
MLVNHLPPFKETPQYEIQDHHQAKQFPSPSTTFIIPEKLQQICQTKSASKKLSP